MSRIDAKEMHRAGNDIVHSSRLASLELENSNRQPDPPGNLKLHSSWEPLIAIARLD